MLFDAERSLVKQSYDSRLTSSNVNLAGFGMVAWDARLRNPAEPLTYRTTSLPVYDRNLRSIARKLCPNSFVGHVRGTRLLDEEVVSTQNLHPFRYPDTTVALSHNGILRSFPELRFALVDHMREEWAAAIEGTTDSEWIYALILSQLPSGETPDADGLATAVRRALAIVRRCWSEHGVETSSPLNLVVATPSALAATRFSLFYGWHVDDDPLLDIAGPYASLWYSLTDSFAADRGGRDGDARAFVLASEPLTGDDGAWFEVPEYSMVTATYDAGELTVAVEDLLV